MTNRIHLAAFACVGMIAGSCAPQAEISARPLGETHLSQAMTVRRGGEPSISILAPADGEVVRSPFVMEVVVTNFELAPAGGARDGEGHFHIRVDAPCLQAGEALPDDDRTIHIGSGDRFAEVALPRGTYQLCAQIGDGFHVAVNITDSMTVVVK